MGDPLFCKSIVFLSPIPGQYPPPSQAPAASFYSYVTEELSQLALPHPHIHDSCTISFFQMQLPLKELALLQYLLVLLFH